MKQKCIWCFHILWCSIALVALCVSCESENTSGITGNTGDLGTLSYDWTDALTVNDTVYLVCNQTVLYSSGNNSQKTVIQNAVIKIWCERSLVEYAAGMNPKPRLSKMYPSDKTYDGINPRRRVIRQRCVFHDGQVVMIELSYDLYSYDKHNREQFFPHVELKDAQFNDADAVAQNGYYRAIVAFDIPWFATDESGSGTQTISVSYLKKRVEEVDNVLSTDYQTGIEWLSKNIFKLYLDKIENWRIAGYKTSRAASPELSFTVSKSNDKSIEAKDFNFVFTRQPFATAKQKVDAPSPWTIKKGTATQTLMFTNGTDYFEDSFTYPLYEATILVDGQTFGFDLNVEFNVVNNVSHGSLTDGKNISSATVKFGGRSFDQSIITQITKKEDNPPVVKTGKGKILYYSVTAVFDTSEADKDDGDITKKCVLVRYEKGYDWGICNYEDAFPKNFAYVDSNYGAYNSAAKKNPYSDFQLARAMETTSAIIWYDDNNEELSGISGLECLILGWKNQYQGKNSYRVEGYSESLSGDSYILTLTAPNGKTYVFDGHDK